MPDHHKIYTGILACIIVVLGSLIGITHFWTKRSHTELAIDHPQIDNHNFILPDEIGYQKAKQLLAHNKIIQAIKSLPNTSTTDKKNQAILRSYLAEQEIQKDTLTGRQQARQYTQQANEILASINDNESLKMQEQNQTIILTTCIVESQAIVQHLTNIVDQQKETQSTIKQIDNMLAKRDLPPSCKTQLKKNIQSNQEAISSWIQNTQAKNISQKETNLKLTETVACDINNIPGEYKTAEQANKQSSKYLFAQQQILSLLIQNPSDLSDQLCQGKNDSDLDNSLTQTMQQLLDPSQPNTKHTSNNEIKYQDIDKDIQTIIHTTQQSSDTAINSIQQTIHDNTYDPSQYIKNLFNQFFGNINDFISP